MNTVMKLALFLPLAVYACGDSGTETCVDQDPEVIFAEAATHTNADLANWEARMDSIVATVPADSVVLWVVFMPSSAKQGVRDWASASGVQIFHEFRGFSAFGIQGAIRSMTGLKQVEGVTGVDFNTQVAFAQACS